MDYENQNNPSERTNAEPQKNNVAIIVIAAVLGTVLLAFLGILAIMGTDGTGLTGIKNKVSGVFGDSQPTVPQATAPVETEPVASEPPAAEPVNLKSYTIDPAKAGEYVDKTVATVGNDKLTNGDLQVYYQTGMIDFYSKYGMYLMYMGVDFSAPLDQQVYDPSTNTSWQEFLMESAFQSWQLFSAIRQYSEENAEYAYELDEEGKEYISGLDSRIQEIAESSGYEDPAQFVKEQIGATATVSGLRRYMEDEYYYMSYYSYLQEKLEPTMEQMEQYYSENEETLMAAGNGKANGEVVDVRHILVMPEGGTTDESGNTTYSEEEWAAAQAEAQAILDEWMVGEATEDSFAKLANSKTEDPGSQNTGGLYSGVKPGEMVTEFNAWIFNEDREAGDTDIVKTPYGYHIMYFVNREAAWVSACRKTCLNDAINAFIENVLTEYPLSVSYDEIGLSN